VTLYDKATPEQKNRADKFWEKIMEITQISEEQVIEMLGPTFMLNGYNLREKKKIVLAWKAGGYIKKSSIDEARELVRRDDAGGEILKHEIIRAYEKAYAELESKIEGVE